MTVNNDIDYKKAHTEIDAAIEASVKESPAPLREIARILNYQYEHTLIYRRFLLGWKRRGGRWVRREDESDE